MTRWFVDIRTALQTAIVNLFYRGNIDSIDVDRKRDNLLER